MKHDPTTVSAQIAESLRDLARSDHLPTGTDYQPFQARLDDMSQSVLNRQARYMTRLMNPSLREGAERVLEIGSGYGVNLLLLHGLGFPEVHGVEIVPPIHEASLLVLDSARARLGFDRDAVVSHLGDAEATPFEAGTFDSLLAVEAISHFPSLDRFFREANRILRPGGLLVAADGNNLSCPSYRRRRLRKWRTIRDEELAKRLDHLRERFPDLDPQLAASIALHTELMCLEEMDRLVPGIRRGDRLPMSLYAEGYPPVFAETGIWDEKGFYPTRLARELRGYGFDAHVRAYVGSARGPVWAATEAFVNRLPGALRFLLRPSFLLYARKIDTPSYLIVRKVSTDSGLPTKTRLID